MNYESSKLDTFDRELIRLLQIDGRRSFTEIAAQMKVSVSTVRNRYTKLVDDKVLHILGWMDPTRTGLNSYNRVTIEVAPSNLTEEVVRELKDIKEVAFLATTSGKANIEINLICRDNLHLMEVMREKIFCIKGVHKTESTIYYNVYKWASHNINQNSEHNIEVDSLNGSNEG